MKILERRTLLGQDRGFARAGPLGQRLVYSWVLTLGIELVLIHQFPAALFTAAERQSQPSCPSSDDWINMYMHTIEYNSAKKNDILIHAMG